jgi:hypothetical protein
MRQATLQRTRFHRSFAALALAVVGAAALFAAVPARADNDFRNGFEDELGRVAAHAVVGAGVQIAFGGPVGYGYAPAYYRPVVRPVYYRPVPVVRVVPVPVHRHGFYCGHPRFAYRGHGHGYGRR